MLMGVNHLGQVPKKFGVGDATAKCPPDFITFQYFKHRTACSTMTQKAHRPYLSHSVFATSKNYIFNVHKISTTGGKFNSFPERTWTKHTAQNSIKHAISSEPFTFSREGPCLQPVLLDIPLHPPEF